MMTCVGHPESAEGGLKVGGVWMTECAFFMLRDGNKASITGRNTVAKGLRDLQLPEKDSYQPLNHLITFVTSTSFSPDV